MVVWGDEGMEMAANVGTGVWRQECGVGSKGMGA